MRINDEGLALIQRYEGCKLKPYRDAVGVWTIGYGSTRGVSEDTPPITAEEAEGLLRMDVAAAERAVSRMVSVPLNENQFSALGSLVFNIGAGNFRDSTMRALINRKSFIQAADEFPRWNRAGGKALAGLTARRAEERALFLRPILVKDAWKGATI